MLLSNSNNMFPKVQTVHHVCALLLQLKERGFLNTLSVNNWASFKCDGFLGALLCFLDMVD